MGISIYQVSNAYDCLHSAVIQRLQRGQNNFMYKYEVGHPEASDLAVPNFLKF